MWLAVWASHLHAHLDKWPDVADGVWGIIGISVARVAPRRIIFVVCDVSHVLHPTRDVRLAFIADIALEARTYDFDRRYRGRSVQGLARWQFAVL